MRSLFLMMLCLSVVFLLSCGGGGESVLEKIRNTPPPPIGSLQVKVYYQPEGSTRTHPLVGVEVGLWRSEVHQIRSGETDITGGWHPCVLAPGDYFVTVRGEIDGKFNIWDYPNDEWFPVTIRADEETHFSYTVIRRNR